MPANSEPKTTPALVSGYNQEIDARLIAQTLIESLILSTVAGAIALVIAVTSLTAVAFLTDRVGRAVEMRAAESLAADLRLGSSQPLAAEYIELAKDAGLQTAAMTSMPSVVFAGFGSGALRFDLRVFIRREDYAQVLDAVNSAIDQALNANGIEMAVESALAAPSLTRAEVDTAGLNRLFDELAFGGMLRQRCLRA